MTPSPEHVGNGIVNLEAEIQVVKTMAEINNIIKNAVNGVSISDRLVLSGIIADREKLPTGETKEYFHPVVTIEDEFSNAYNEGGFDEVALGGTNFFKLFPLNYVKDTIDWGGDAGIKKFQEAHEDSSNPFEEFFNGIDDCTHLSLDELHANLLNATEDKNHPKLEALKSGEVADFLLPRTVDAQLKLNIAQRILTGLKNAGGLK